VQESQTDTGTGTRSTFPYSVFRDSIFEKRLNVTGLGRVIVR
jgi:hypothetical protein